jgi:hypothetical protein
MIVPGVALLTYVWHYTVARLVFDDFVRPLTHGSRAAVIVAIGCAGVAGFLLGRRRGRKSR